jgi:hypothetical protein
MVSDAWEAVIAARSGLFEIIRRCDSAERILSTPDPEYDGSDILDIDHCPSAVHPPDDAGLRNGAGWPWQGRREVFRLLGALTRGSEHLRTVSCSGLAASSRQLASALDEHARSVIGCGMRGDLPSNVKLHEQMHAWMGLVRQVAESRIRARAAA